MGAGIIYRRFYADHHRFSPQEILNAIDRTRNRGGHFLVTTEKDAVRFPQIPVPGLPVYFLRVEIELINAPYTLEECIRRICGLEPEPARAGSHCVL